MTEETINKLKKEIMTEEEFLKERNNRISQEVKTEEERDNLIKRLQELEFKKPLPKTYNELGRIQGWNYRDGKIWFYDTNDIPLFHTEKQAKKALAMAQLSQLMAVYNDGWEADFTDTKVQTYSINYVSKRLTIHSSYSVYYFLTFKTKELAREFLSNFEDLIKTFFEIGRWT